ncbi:MAG: hypothetical protein KG028_13440 [Actinobacteria bacterium]|jgi:hypothetical protein|nr:hypothetical protein [Actinomycetota bacterium]
MKPSNLRRRSRVAVLSVVLLAATACGAGDNPSATIETAAAPGPGDPAQPDTDAAEAAPPAEYVDPVRSAEQLAAVSMPLSEARDPFEPVRDEPAATVGTTAGEGVVVPAAPAAPGATEPAPVPAASPAPQPTSEPTAATCELELARCLADLRLLDAGTGNQGPAIFQLGTTLYEVELGAGFADAFVLLRLEDDCATVAHADGVTQRCIEPDSSLK